jgi:hypothetical protein
MFEFIRNLKVQFVYKSGHLLVSRLNHIYHYNPASKQQTLLYTLPYQSFYQNVIKSTIVNRLLRADIHHIIARDNKNMVVFFDRRIIRIGDGDITHTFHIKTCKRPINVMWNHKANVLAWGDYIISKEEKPAGVFVSRDFGVTWKNTYTFTAGSIRHIHNIIWDEYRKHYWILTGDTDTESGIWKSVDLNDAELFLGGSQKYRAVSIIPEQHGIIIPTDTPLAENKIQFYDYESQILTDLAGMRSSGMYAQKVNGNYFCSTMFEKSTINKYPIAELWHSNDGKHWSQILTLRKDMLPIKYFQNPIIGIPAYENGFAKNAFYFNARSVKGNIGSIIWTLKKKTPNHNSNVFF